MKALTTKQESFVELVKKAIPPQKVIGILKELINGSDKAIANDAIKIYVRFINSEPELELDMSLFDTGQEKCAVKGCMWNYQLDEHHIDHNPENNDPKNKIKICPNHHYLHHRKGIKLEDLHKFI